MEFTNNINDEAIGEVEVKKAKKKMVVHYQLPNVARAYETEYYLTDVEMAILVQIGVNVTAFDTNITKTNVDILNAELQIDKNLSRGRSTINESIVSLQQKGYIKVDCSGKSIEDSPLLTINILHELNDISVTKDGTTFTGFTTVTKKVLGLAKQGKPVKFGQRLKILTHIKWRNEINYSISFTEWANVLSVVNSTAKSNIKKLEKDGIIEILHGEYKRNEDGSLYFEEDGRPKQERNTYFLAGDKPEVAESYRPTAHKKHKRNVAIDKAIEKIMSEGEPRIAERPQLVMYGSKLATDDIAIFLTTESSTLENMSREKFAVILGGEDKKKSDSARRMLLDWEREVRSWYEGKNGDKIKRSIFNLDNLKLSENEQELTPDELKSKVDVVGYDNGYEEDEFAYDDINSDGEKESIRKRNTVEDEEESKSIFDTPEWIERMKKSVEESENESDFGWGEQQQQEYAPLPFD